MTEEADFLQIKSVDHVHFYVGNAKHAMYFWWKAFGFKPVAYSGLETGNRDFASYVLESGRRGLLFLRPTHRAARSPRITWYTVTASKSSRWKWTMWKKHGKKLLPAEENLHGRRAKKKMITAFTAPPQFTRTAKPSMSSWTAPITKAPSHPPTNPLNYETQSTGLAPLTTSSAMCSLAK
jgi:hypothetical protein